MSESEQTSRFSSTSSQSPIAAINTQLTQAATENNPVPITCHKLNSHNYLQWFRTMMMFIRGHNRDDYLTGVATQTNLSDPKFKIWKAKNKSYYVLVD